MISILNVRFVSDIAAMVLLLVAVCIVTSSFFLYKAYVESSGLSFGVEYETVCL